MFTSTHKKRAASATHASSASAANEAEDHTDLSSVDGDVLEFRLAQCVRMLHGQSTGVVERLCQELADASLGQVYLHLLRYQPAQAAPLAGSSPFTFPLQLGKRVYGRLVVEPDPKRPDQPVLSYQRAQRLAIHCTFLLYNLEAAAFFRREYPSPVEQPVSLTPREQEVLNLLCRHFTRKQIASMLHIASGTVGKYYETIYEQLGVHSEREAVAAAFTLGLYSPVEHLWAAIDEPSRKDG